MKFSASCECDRVTDFRYDCDRKTDRQTDRQTDRETVRETVV